LDKPEQWGGRECDGNLREKNEQFNFNPMHVEFRGGKKDLLLFESLDFRKRVMYGLEKKLRRP
jgi:hypothetical protein